MRSIAATAVAMILASCSASIHRDSNAENDEDTVGELESVQRVAQAVNAGAAGNWEVVVGVDSGKHCTGILVTNSWVLTARHCELDVGNPANITVTRNNSSESRTATRALLHPGRDMALVRVALPFSVGGSTTGW